MKSNFYERRQSRIERYFHLAIKAKNLGQASFELSDKLASVIPMGQPILVGHHSERGHRAYLKRIHNLMDKGLKLRSKARYYNSRAVAAENNNAIFSDDPEAVTKLKAKIEKLEQMQTYMKEANKIIKNKKLSECQKIEWLAKMDISTGYALKLLQPDFCGRIGFADYQLQNNNANIRTNKLRLERLLKAETEDTTINILNGVKVVDNVDENRYAFVF